MLILALDTSSAAGSAALVRDGGLVIARPGDPRRMHGERLPRELMLLLEEAGVTVHQVDLLTVITGPGSFTGLRVGIAAIQGLALANDRLVVPVSAFEALAWFARDGSAPIAAWIDAHRGEIFAQLHASDGRVIVGPSSRPPDATLDAWQEHLTAIADGPIRFLGDGAARYADAIGQRLGERAVFHEGALLLAEAAGRIAARAPERAVRPHAIAPLYVRRPDAELARDRRKFD
jgi:tRNA threonylcarbamoyladenosine biosynthesis protein TsaB